MLTQDGLYQLRLSVRATMSFILSILIDPIVEWETELEANPNAPSTPDLTRTVSELQQAQAELHRLNAQMDRVLIILKSGTSISPYRSNQQVLTFKSLNFQCCYSKGNMFLLTLIMKQKYLQLAFYLFKNIVQVSHDPDITSQPTTTMMHAISTFFRNILCLV